MKTNAQQQPLDINENVTSKEASTILINRDLFSNYYLGTLFDTAIRANQGETGIRMPRNVRNRLQNRWDRYTPNFGDTTSYGDTRQGWLNTLLESLGYDRLETARAEDFKEKQKLPDGCLLYRPNQLQPADTTAPQQQPFSIVQEIAQETGDTEEEASADAAEQDDAELSTEDEKSTDHAVLILLLNWGADFDRPFPNRNRRSDMPHKFVERLLASGGPARWGILCNGRRIRLLRRDVVAGRQQYYEVDLEALFDNLSEQDANLKEQGFDTFWTLFRAQSFQLQADGRCLLAILEQESRKHAEGVSARLKNSVFLAIDALMQALVARAHELLNLDMTGADQDALRRRSLAEQALNDLPGLYKQSLVFLYRLLFVLYAESRSLLPVDNGVYSKSYSLLPLRDEIELPDIENRYRSDSFRLWETLQSLFRLIHWGCNTTQLVVPAYDGNLLDPRSTRFLNAIRLPDKALANVLLQLSVTPETKKRGRERIDYRDLGVEQLGAVYEGLLEYEPRIATELMVEVRYKDARVIIPQREQRNYKPIRDYKRGEFYLGHGAGRKTSGSYYTPQPLVDFLVKRTLDPLVQGKSAEQILELKVVDPAMGSGAFLVGACLYLTEAYARALRQENIQHNPANVTQQISNLATDSPDSGNVISEDANGYSEQQELSEEATRPYRRLIAERCIYGVDFNEMAVELAKVSLWLTTLAGDKPLTFLDANLRWGNSLVGAPLHTAGYGQENIYTIYTIHEEANKHLAEESGDTLTSKRKQSKRGTIWDDEENDEHTLDDELNDVRKTVPALVDKRSWIAEQPSDTVAQVHDKANIFQHNIVENRRRQMLEQICNLWVASWFWKQPPLSMRPDEPGWMPPLDGRIYTELVSYIRASYGEDVAPLTDLDPGPYLKAVNEIVKTIRPFHWPLEFPEVYFGPDGQPLANPGFAAVLGNPPWDTVKPNSREFFASYDPGFRDLEKVDADNRQEELLKESEINFEWDKYKQNLNGQMTFTRFSDIYLHQTTKIEDKKTGSDVNTYKLFLERAYQLTRFNGKVAQIVKADIYKGQGATGLRQLLLQQNRCDFLYALSNERRIFSSIHHAERFALVGFTKGIAGELVQVSFAITTKEALPPSGLSTYLTDPERILEVPDNLIKRMSPDTLSIMEFRSQQDVNLVAKIYGDHPLLGEESVASAWSANFTSEFHMTNDRKKLFNQEHTGWSLYEGKMIDQYVHLFSEPQYWVEPEKGCEELIRKELKRVEKALDAVAISLGYLRKVGTCEERIKDLLRRNGREPLNAKDVCIATGAARLVFRSIASNTNRRTIISTILPSNIFAGNSLNYLENWQFDAELALTRLNDIKSCYRPSLPAPAMAYLCGVLNSFAMDYVIRFKVSANVNIFYVYQLPIPRLTSNDQHCRAIANRVARLVCIGPEFDDLRRELLGSVDAHVATIQDERQRLQNEIDALVAHLYGLQAEDLQHILYAPYTFPLVKREIKDGVMDAFARVEELLDGER